MVLNSDKVTHWSIALTHTLRTSPQFAEALSFHTDKGKLFVLSYFTDGKTGQVCLKISGSGNPHSKATDKTHLAYIFHLRVYVTSSWPLNPAPACLFFLKEF